MDHRLPRALAAMLVLAALALAVAAGGSELGPGTRFAPACAAAIAAVAIVVATLMAQRFDGRGGVLALLVSCSFLFAGIVLGTGSVLEAGPVAAAWTWALALGGLAFGLALSAWGGPRELRRTLSAPGLRRTPILRAALGLTAAAAIGAVVLARALPEADAARGAVLVLPAGLFSLLVATQRGRRGDFERWLPILAGAALAAAITEVSGPDAGQLGWYAARVATLAAFTAFLCVLLAELGHLQRRLGAADPRQLDALTAMPTREAVLEIAGDLQGRRGPSVPLSIALIDLDHLHVINERFGRLAGDAALRVVADRVREAIRDEDVVGRFGEGFIVILPGTDLPGATLAAERTLMTIRASPAWGGPHEVSVTASAGVAPVAIGPGSLDQAIDLAATALQTAKSTGRDRVVTEGRTRPAIGAQPPAEPAAAPAPRAA